VTVRDGNRNETPVVKAYREKRYNEVMRIMDIGEDHTAEGKFLGGAAALEMDDNQKAITWFKEVLESNKKTGKSILDDEAEYYLALGYIRNKDYDYALDLLYKIRANPNHLYNKKVTAKLIRQVKILKWR
jgi:tetratricopeptide (TPR) repeat protein